VSTSSNSRMRRKAAGITGGARRDPGDRILRCAVAPIGLAVPERGAGVAVTAYWSEPWLVEIVGWIEFPSSRVSETQQSVADSESSSERAEELSEVPQSRVIEITLNS
jgi:hypothetical protein